jgi:amino acid transporter
VQFIGQIAAVVWLRRQSPDLKRPFRIWLYPLPVFVALVGWIFLLVTTDKMTLAYAVGTLGAGVVFFLVWSRWTRRWPFAEPSGLQAA